MRVRTCMLGEGMPKICVPVMGKDPAEMAEAAKRARAAEADLIELRIDSLSEEPSCEMAEASCRAVCAASGLPVLFTMRTKRDGGPGSADAKKYETLLTHVAGAGVCDAVDCELSAGEDVFRRVVRAAHGAGIPVIGSSHAFDGVSDLRLLAQWYERQQALGADVCKAAVMTHSPQQAIEAALEMMRAGGTLSTPYIAIVMGGYGVFTRAACGIMGSCLTFGTAGQASAPGQMDARVLRGILRELDRAQNGSR